MKTYLVGGAVRDRLLDLPIREKDYVVVGATEDEMLAQGYRQVGRDFPVFLHPDTADEYALARTEKKTGPGHQGFVCHASPEVTLEEDLQRRDLTINAIAQDTEGQLLDPWNGAEDLNNRMLRHVSPAFTEDPLRILRVARFKAYLHHLGFEIAGETDELLRTMVAEGVLSELTPERVVAEMDKALLTQHPAEFFVYLATIGADKHLWPEIDAVAVNRLANLQHSDPETRFACLLLDQDEKTIRAFCMRMKCSNRRTDNTVLVSTHLEQWATLDTMSAEEIVLLLEGLDAFRRQPRFDKFNASCEMITGAGLSDRWQQLLALTGGISAANLDTHGASGPEIGSLLQQARIDALKAQLSE